MKIIFLDIDGCLNSGDYIADTGKLFDDPKYQINPAAVKRLNQIISLTGAKIVVSSTWRLSFLDQCENPIKEMQSCLDSYNIVGEVIGLTPHKPNCVRNQRGKEIQAWLNDNLDLKVKKFVIIDDDSDMGKLKIYQVKTLFKYGLQDEHTDQVLKILKE